MCGIFGSFGINDKTLLKKAVRSMSYRGPDSEGFYTDNEIMLGVRRLSIIDLDKGNQPIYNEDKSIVVICNGEIYNYKELRTNLEKKGHEFYTDSDTEVIVHSYEEYGEKCVNYFNGMYAIALWDSIKKKLFIIRDRLGIKPLYYYQKGNTLLFSSEIKALLKYKEIKRKFDTDILPYYLKYRYVKNPNTFIKQIKKIRPGHFLKISKKKIVEKKYWNLILAGAKKIDRTVYSKVNTLLEDSINKRLIADVPLGLFLSGGLDSSSILYYMKKIKESKIKTFTIGFENDDYTNEFPEARKVAAYFSTDHHEINIDTKTAIESIPNVITHLEEPVADATAVSSYFLSNFASKHVKTVLTGEGADEVFRGYVHYENMIYYNKINRLPLTVQNIFSKVIKPVPKEILSVFFKYPLNIGEQGKQRLINLLSSHKTEKEAFDEFISLYSRPELERITDKPIKKIKNEIVKPNDSIFQTMSYYDFNAWLPDYILSRVDKMTMANSLECRVPYLDHNLVDFVTKLRFRKNHYDKNILRKTMKNHLPKSITKKKKFPFFTPINHWFKFGLKEYYESIFDDSILIKNKLIEKDYIDKIIRNHDKSSLINSRKLWSLMTLEICHRKFISI